MTNRAIIFLISSFLSAVGDALLVFAVPVGMGLETGDLRSAVLMWLIPAVAMFLSSFLNSRLERRQSTARSDYGKLLLGVAFLEALIAVAALFLKTPLQTVLLITGFVFFYALAKEGVPRLLYVVSVYRYFAEPKNYTQVAGLASGLNILAALAGTFLAGWLVSVGSWRIALVLDAGTFVALGVAVLVFGRDPREEKLDQKSQSTPPVGKGVLRSLSWIQVLVPLIFGINALIWNYLPILSQNLSILSSTSSIFLIGLLRFPGMVSGFLLQRIARTMPVTKLVWVVPVAYLAVSLGFSAAPSVALFCTLVVAQGLLSGVYWPADFTVRNSLSHSALIRFNTLVLRKMAITQFVACLAALWIFSPGQGGFDLVPLVSVGLVLISAAFHFLAKEKRGIVAATLALCLGGGACSGRSGSGSLQVILPSVSHNLELRSDLTYAATALLNDTSAHLVRVSRDLTIQGEVLDRYESLEGGKIYLLDLKPDFRSSRGNTIDAEDVAFTLRYYLSEKKALSGALSSILGSEACFSRECKLKGLKVLNGHRLEVTLKEPDIKWIEKLASPWLILLKKGQPTTETVGDCTLPYQTGSALVTACDSSGIHLSIGSIQVLLREKSPISGTPVSRLLTESPNYEISPSLTVMTAFPNPASQRLSAAERVRLVSAIRTHSKLIATALHLKTATLLTPEWLGVSVPKDLLPVTGRTPAPACPKVGPLRVLLDTSLPRLDSLKAALRTAVGCPVEFSVTNADTYFQEFAKVDIGVAWFTPDFLDIYNVFAPFDCSVANACPFNWKDGGLQRKIDRIRSSGFLGQTDKNAALEIERQLLAKGYAAPIAEMNWWIEKSDKTIAAIHPAGLFQVRIGDFL